MEHIESATLCEWVQEIATEENLNLTDIECITLGNLLHDRLFPRAQDGEEG